MKKILFVAAATTLALSSCSDNEITSMVQTNDMTPVKINVYSQAQTRVTETNLTTIQTNGFKLVIADNNGEKLNTDATYTAANGWSYGNTEIYWPTNGSALTFYGLYPSADITDGTANITTDGTTDVVAAYVNTAMPTNGQVSLSFAHVLSQLAINARGNNDNFNYSVTNVTITAPAAITYNFSDGSAEPVDSAPYIYLNSANGVSAPYSATAYTDLNTTHAILPAAEMEISVSYTVTLKTDATDSQNFTKTATITTVKGQRSVVNLTLPSDRTPITFTVAMDSDWADGTTPQTPTLN